VGPGAGLDAVKTKDLSLPGIEPRVRPTCSLVTVLTELPDKGILEVQLHAFLISLDGDEIFTLRPLYPKEIYPEYSWTGEPNGCIILRVGNLADEKL
jgi:hypothetical protein